jgi:WXG100 family type VII secretion target
MSNTGGSSWEGMNPEVVEAQARILHGLSEDITALMNKIEVEVTQLADAWHGADAKQFAADWAGTHKPVFTTAATLLASMGDTSLRNATAQQATSSH